uniref:Uncharacterized protein n=1 Tax=Vitis vinifera TaxID=29760 RepID=F6I5I4_VITVI
MVALEAHIAFGLRFSALTIMKQNPVGSFNGKVRGGQVNKTVEILGLEIYCSTSQGTLSLIAIDDAADSKLGGDARLEGNKNDYILAPFDVSMTLLVCIFDQNPFTIGFAFLFVI